MTPEDWAKGSYVALCQEDCVSTMKDKDRVVAVLTDTFRQALLAAVDAEREACAEVVAAELKTVPPSEWHFVRPMIKRIVAVIRSRSPRRDGE